MINDTGKVPAWQRSLPTYTTAGWDNTVVTIANTGAPSNAYNAASVAL